MEGWVSVTPFHLDLTAGWARADLAGLVEPTPTSAS